MIQPALEITNCGNARLTVRFCKRATDDGFTPFFYKSAARFSQPLNLRGLLEYSKQCFCLPKRSFAGKGFRCTRYRLAISRDYSGLDSLQENMRSASPMLSDAPMGCGLGGIDKIVQD